MRFSFAPLVLALFVPSLIAQGPPDVALKAKAVFEKHCYACHGKEGSNEGGFNFILNHERLLAGKKVVPSDAKGSRLLKRMVSEEMPPDEDLNGKAIKDRPSPQDVATVKAWIEAGAPDFNAKVAARAFISNTDILELIHKDLLAANDRSRKFLRYFTITHLHNAGLSDDELLSYRVGLSKLVNSLSWGREVKVPEPIDPAKTIFRIDIRHYGWKETTWERILAANPYGVTYKTTAAKGCYDLCQTTLPHVRADWFVFAASRPPLYHDVLELPKTDHELEKQLRVDVAENLRTEEVARAAFNGSGVSRNNRLIERHKSPYGAYWKSYDFASNVGRQNLFERPLGPGATANLFKHDGGEIIFNLLNGLQAYFLTDGLGQRIDKGPINVVSDPKQADRSVVNGISCMTCHNQGMLAKTDQIRDHVEKNAEGFTKAEAESIKALYPVKADFEKLLKEDAERFRKAVEACGAHLSKTEPVYALSGQFEKEIDLKLAAAEVGVTAEDFGKGLSRSPKLARLFGILRVEGGTVQRQVLVEHFEDLAAVLLTDGTFRRAGDVSPLSLDDKLLVVDLGGNVKLRMIRIPKGSFLMGSKKADVPNARDYEQPQHTVELTKDFYLGETEVTVGQFKQFVADTQYVTDKEKAGVKVSIWKNPGFKEVQTDEHPVVYVSHNDAVKYCVWVSKKTGHKYGLPTEAQWEYACRAGSKSIYSFGDDTKQLGDYAWIINNTKDTGTRAVRQKKPNAFGLYDMHGNACEWCSDWYNAKEYTINKRTDPLGAADGSVRVFRGGSWRSYADDCRAAYRSEDASPYGDRYLGLRLARVPSGK